MHKHVLFIFFLLVVAPAFGQQSDSQDWWHNQERTVHYLPEGNDFICVNPTRRFNRALYGTHSAFRVETGDLPEFALYMPGMGGNLRFALVRDNQQKWLTEAKQIKTIYRPGSMLYTITDEWLEEGRLLLTVLALSQAEGMVIQVRSENIPDGIQLGWLFGGASGKKFSRDGDIGADPESSFYLKPENCTDNRYHLQKEKFLLSYGTGKVLTEEERYEIQTQSETALKGEWPANAKSITGYFPATSTVKLIDATKAESAFNQTAPPQENFCIAGKLNFNTSEEYFLLHNSATPISKTAAAEFAEAETVRQKLADRVRIHTPDSFLNTLGGALAVAADAIWEAPTFMHGAVAWRMRLPGWRGAFAADPLGWHDRARLHFNAYSKSQLTTAPETGVVMDTALNLARHLEKLGTQLFSEGYITRNPNGYLGAHHYDMNLGFVDQLLNHFNYTGDTSYVREIWPLLKRHLAWEKKNFDADGDGLYDAYAAIWASDALQYSGGGVTHSSAYNYRANKEVAALAVLIGENGSLYYEEAEKIRRAIHDKLWMQEKGWYAEYKDLLGNQLVHPAAAIWTIYHAIDSKVPDAFQAYQSLRYIDNHIPHIPVRANGWNEKNLYLLSVSNWQPYTWSLNNVAFAENLHTALAYWQGNRKEEAFQLWRSAILETMYLSAGPGNFQQLSYYDAIRGELYRDFADGIGMTARTLIEGLFGFLPDALHKRLLIQPGFPAEWNHASIETPDIQFDFVRTNDEEKYAISSEFYRNLDLQLILPAQKDGVTEIKANGKLVNWEPVPDRMGHPSIKINLPAGRQHIIQIKWKGNPPEKLTYQKKIHYKDELVVSANKLSKFEIFDPQQVLANVNLTSKRLFARVQGQPGHKTFFIKTKQADFTWWQPVDILITGDSIVVKQENKIQSINFEPINLAPYFNDSVTQIFRNKYLSPRPTSPTLQLPVQGIGNWAYHSTQFTVSDSGLRKLAGTKNEIITSTGIPFQTPGTVRSNNIIFTSQWDNYPDSVLIPLQGQASEAWFMMAGSTNPMQSRLLNGVISIHYTDGSSDKLELTNPGNWWPIEQQYYVDGYAFTTDAPRPMRIALKTGKEIQEDFPYISIKGFSNFGIEGGAATVLSLPLQKNKQLKHLSLKAVANDVVIGLMSVTLVK